MPDLSPPGIADIGPVIPTPGRDAPAGLGLDRWLGNNEPAAQPPGSGPRGVDRGAELLGRLGSACPELRRPVWSNREVAVSVGFVVDTNGRVDSETLRVIQSPNRRDGGSRSYSHIYTVAAAVRDDPDRLGRTAYDSLVTRAVTDHVADLLFRPALSAGRAIRATILVSCQTT